MLQSRMCSFVSPPLMPVLRLTSSWSTTSKSSTYVVTRLKLISCMHTHCHTLDTSPLHPFPVEGGKDCSDDHTLWICARWVCYSSFHRPPCPCSVWFVVDPWASRTTFGRRSVPCMRVPVCVRVWTLTVSPFSTIYFTLAMTH
jgi:hypothetical protein